MPVQRSLIVGAGIGGLAAGVALRRAGGDVRIFERAASPRELGFALSLAPNAMAALRELGVADVLMAEGAPLAEVEARRADGRLLRRLNVAAARDAGSASVVALRQALHGALLNAIGPDALSLNSEAIGFDVTPAGIVLELVDGRTAVGEMLVGADGLGSIIRRLLHPHEPPPRSSGYFGIRGVAFDVGHHLGDLSAVAYFGDGIEAATVRASKHAVYWYMSLLAEDVRIEPRDMLVGRSAARLDDPFQAIVQGTRPEDLRVDELFDRDPLESWGAGPVTLLGDAAHPMLPHTGQGAAQALEDAVALGLAMAPDGDPIAGLRTYERIRSLRTRRLVKLGRRIARVTTTKNRAIGWLRDRAIEMVPAKPILAAFQLAEQRDPHRELRSVTR